MTPPDWRRKIAALLHDGVLKHDAAYFSHDGKRGARQNARVLGAPVEEGFDPDREAKLADLWASGADRPELGHGGHVFVPWRIDGRVTHPLCESALALLPVNRTSYKPTLLLNMTMPVVKAALESPLDETRWHWLWRAQRRALREDGRPADIPAAAWARYVDLHPADTRCPDVSIWDHVRMTSALAWLSDGGDAATRQPYLLHVAVGPVGRWLREARTTRDTWLGSMLLSELSLAAMDPVIRACGPDAIIYPDLARNLRYDRELARRPDGNTILTPAELGARTRSALIPNRWLAVVPERPGGMSIAELGERCQRSAESTWIDICEQVLEGFLEFLRRELRSKVDAAQLDLLARDWCTQVRREGELYVHVAAMPWHATPNGLPDAEPSIALPGQVRDEARERAWREARRDLLAWVPADELRQYDAVQPVWRMLRSRRKGGDYAPHQHAVRAVLAARDLARTFAAGPIPAGDACTVCGHRAALAAGDADADRQRRSAGAFWGAVAEHFKWDAGEKERLCGVCATRRFIVPPWDARLPLPTDDRPLSRFHHVWARAGHDDAGKRGLQLPMPSTAAIAAGPWLAKVLSDDRLADTRRAAHSAIGDRWPKTHFPASLHVVGGSVPDRTDEFTWYEPSMYYDGPRLAELAARDAQSANSHDAVIKRALEPLYKPPHGRPSSRFAVIAVDGDRLGELLLGKSIRATWSDVLHPSAVQRITEQADAGKPWAEAWRPLLSESRLMGPSLHAFINRALTAFANRIVPWVVEREFAGRLIYAGGDDVLALAPAAHALGIAYRLQELWSAPWVHDTMPHAFAWGPDASASASSSGAKATWDPDRDRARFETHDGDETLTAAPRIGEIIPMLGPHHSLSAGIAYAHFKTPLGLVIEAAREALNQDAKQLADRAACAERLFTRGGPKLSSVFRWNDSGFDIRAVRRIRDDFREGKLPARMPYKLRGNRAAFGALGVGEHAQLAAGLVRVALDGRSEQRAADLGALWVEGIRAFRDADIALGNLLLCRALATEEDDR